jgi:hypothetical protein
VVYAVAIAATVIVGAGVASLRIREDGLPLVLAVTLVAVATIARRQRLLIVMGGIAYVWAIHWVYVDFVVPVYAYSGLIDVGVPWPSLVLVSIVAVAPTVWLPIGLQRPSDGLLWILYLFGYVPAVAIPIYILGPDVSRVLPWELMVAVAFGLLALMQRVPRRTLSWPGISDLRFTRLLVTVGLGGIVYLFIVFAPTSPPPDLASVYETRSQYAAIASTAPLSGYLVIWLGNVIYPFLLVLGLSRSRITLLVLGLSGQLLIYTITGLKSMLFSVVLLPFLYLAIRHARRHFGNLEVWSALVLVVLSVAATLAMNSLYPLALFVTRLIAIPGQLSAYYYDFFSSHQPYLLSESFLRWFISSPYDREAPRLIGRIYTHSAMDANANIWADAMANFGLLGIIPFTIVFGVVLWILDSVASDRDLRVVGPVVGYAGLYLANAALFTQILTGGIALIVVLVALMPKTETSPALTLTESAPDPGSRIAARPAALESG